MRKCIAAALLATLLHTSWTSAAWSQQNFKFIADVLSPNEIAANSNAATTPGSGLQQNFSPTGTMSASAGTGLNDMWCTAANSVMASIGPYNQPRMSLAAYSDLALAMKNSAAFPAFSNEIRVQNTPPGTGTRACNYFGIVASDVHPTGTPCTITGTVTAEWTHAGPWTVNSRNMEIQITINGGGGAFLGVASNMGAATITKRVGGVQLPGQTLNLNSDSTSLQFNLPATVGSAVQVTFESDHLMGGGVPAFSQNHDNQQFDVNIDVGP